jgi:hypothetical protein
MRSIFTSTMLVLALFVVGATAHAQGTFNRVYQILQQKCASCHGGTSPIAYDLGTTPAQSYAALVGVTPLNPAAAAKGYKRIDPGHPYNSFLLKKIGTNLEGYFNLSSPDEGNPMPYNAPSLSAYEAELIRQWIITGAKQTGTQVDTSIIYNYYTNGGLAFEAAPPAPSVDSGFQIRFGPVFLPTAGSSGSEIEYLKKEHLRLPADKDVVRLDGDMNPSSHHFLLFMFDDSVASTQYTDGLRVVDVLHTATDGDKKLQIAWQYDHSVNLPAQTAFFYDRNDWLDLNYHIRNYSTSQILPADFYLNVYTTPRGSGNREMRGQLVNNSSLFLLPGNNSVSMDDTWGGDDRELWMISSHTHKYGTDFDIFIKDSVSGGRGPQIYEGFYDRNYTFNQGFYDWVHPAIRVFDPLYTIHASEGLIFDTEYTNTSGSFVTFGLTTNDEMQLSTYLYVNKHETPLVSTDPLSGQDLYNFSLYPNPTHAHATIDFGGVRRTGKYEVVDINGRLLGNGTFRQSSEVKVPRGEMIAGLYLVRILLDNGKVMTRKLLVQ